MTDLTERDVVLSILKRESQNWKDRFGVLKVGLFGSKVRDEAGERGDIDLLIEFDPESVNYKKYPDPNVSSVIIPQNRRDCHHWWRISPHSPVYFKGGGPGLKSISCDIQLQM